MDELDKPWWWISVVTAGLLINLVSAYLKPRIDALLFAGSERWRLRSASRVAARNAEIEALARDDDAMTSERWKVGVLLWVTSCSLAAPTLPAVLVALTDKRPIPSWMTIAVGVFLLVCASAAIALGRRTYDTVRKIGAAESRRRSEKQRPQP